MYATINNKSEFELHTDNYDLCFSCKHTQKCPLIQAISKEYVIMHYSDIEVNECGLYKVDFR